MDWCRLDTSFYLDPAVIRAGEQAEVLFLRCLAYSGAKETRGVVPKAVLPMLAPGQTKARMHALIDNGLLIDRGSDLQIRSWERWQESLDKESERRKKDRERKAAERAVVRGPVRGQSTDVSTDSPTDMSTGLSVDTAQDIHRKIPRIEVEVEVEQKTSSSGARKRRAKPRTAAPDIFPITPAMATWGREHAPLVGNPTVETDRFLDHHRATGTLFADWTSAWRKWMSKANEYAETRPTVRATGGGPNRDTPWFN